MEKEQKSLLLPLLGLIAAMLLWGSSFIFMKIALMKFPPMLVIFARMFFASLVFLAFRNKLGSIRATIKDWKLFLLMALFEPCLYFIFESYALLNTTASQAGMITSLLPLLVSVGAGWFLGEKTTTKSYAGFLVAIAGVILLSVGGESTISSPDPLLGNFLEFLAMVCAMGYTLSAKKLSDRHSTWLVTAFQAWVGAIFFLPALATFPMDLLDAFPWDAFWAVLYLGLGVSILAYGLYNYSLKYIDASQVSAYINLIPVFTLFMGWAILDETLSMRQILAILIVFTGVLISQDNLFESFFRKKKPAIP